MENPDDLPDRKIDLSKAYDRMAHLRDFDRYEEWKRRERREFASRLIGEGKLRLLEVGCGTGRDAQWFGENGLSVIGIDLSVEMVRLCRKKGIEARVMDLQNPDFEEGSFDAVFALNALVHVPGLELRSTLEQIRKVLAPEGLFYLGQYGGSDFEGVLEKDNYRPKRFFSFPSEARLREAMQGLFESVSWKTIPLEGRDYQFFSSVWRRSKI